MTVPRDAAMAPGPLPRLLRGRIAEVAAVSVAVLSVVSAAVLISEVRARAATGTGVVTGVVWRDLDSDGYRDSGEPGIPRVVIARLGTSATTTTNSDGRWSLTLASGTQTISAITGWLPSKCPGDLNCAAGRTPNQDFAVENQFVRAHVTVPAGGTLSGIDLGLEPDYGDPTGSPTSIHSGNDKGDGPAKSHDLAVRHSSNGFYPGCTDRWKTRVCPIGTRLSNLGQIYNQGTSWVTDIRFVIVVPPGCSLSRAPVVEAATPGAQPARTGRTGRTADGGTWIEFTLGRNLPPAGAVWFSSTYTINSGPSPQPYGTGSNYDRKGFVSISAVTPAEDDAPLRVDPRLGKDKGHNVNWPVAVDDDTSDAVEFNVG